jgi:Spy/CpxP family protein refolding chaperone
MLKSIRMATMGAATVAILAFSSLTSADTTTRPAPATAPADLTPPHVAPPPTAMRPGPTYVIQRYKNAIRQLDITEDEKPKVDAVFDHANQEGLDLSTDLADTPLAQRFQKLSTFGQHIHQQLTDVLTVDQMKLLDQKLSGATIARPSGKTTAANGLLETMQQALNKLDLSDDQKKQVKDLLAATATKLADIRKNAASGGNPQQEIQQLRKDLREKLQAILTPEQMQQLASAFQQRGAAGPQRPNRNNSSNETITENKPLDLQITGPEPGSPVPDAAIIETNGRIFSPSQYKGHVVVLEFGSMSCPVFRTHVQDMEKLKSSEGGRAFFLIVYTREAFPAGDKNVERNRDEGINIQQAKNLDERKAQALETQRELRITIPMAVDSMSDAVSNAYGSFPNGTVVIGKDGAIAARQQWTNPDTLRGIIDAACNAPTTRPINP